MLISFVFKLQEAEAEKADLVAQATDVITQKTELGEAQKALQHQLNEVKALIGEFEERELLSRTTIFRPDYLNHETNVLCRII